MKTLKKDIGFFERFEKGTMETTTKSKSRKEEGKAESKGAYIQFVCNGGVEEGDRL